MINCLLARLSGRDGVVIGETFRDMVGDTVCSFSFQMVVIMVVVVGSEIMTFHSAKTYLPLFVNVENQCREFSVDERRAPLLI